MKKEPINIRVDYLTDGTLIPRTFIDNSGKSRYIRKIIQVESTSKKPNVQVYICELKDEIVKIVYDNGVWYLVVIN